MGSTYKLDDSVIARIAQILQESMLFSTDCCDSMRCIELEPAPTDEFGVHHEKLVMTRAYSESVKAEWETQLKRAEELKGNR